MEMYPQQDIFFPDSHWFKIWLWVYEIHSDNKKVISYSNCELKLIALMGIPIFNDTLTGPREEFLSIRDCYPGLPNHVSIIFI